jgi:hypothetical protein
VEERRFQRRVESAIEEQALAAAAHVERTPLPAAFDLDLERAATPSISLRNREGHDFGRAASRQNISRIAVFPQPRRVTSDLVPKINLRNHGRSRNARVSPNRSDLSSLLSIFWYLSSLKTIFCEIRLRRPAPVKAFGGIAIKKYFRDPPSKPKRPDRRMPAKLYFGGEITFRTAAKRQKATKLAKKWKPETQSRKLVASS